ncbi:autotransporter assembly complex protein TamA [Sphingomonas donggukensis]|uniref:Autotransporter assembly complex protein TamA n=1 Tax=Sphingomonas donggukensis TaxID=2949093 RepID=A0ABY4TWI5_9SPHN|nr:autotransporter assembly complex family protein [Sphingomonas donggukensis]URW75514.1 autotransporter assembly complex protein TamA [Sphingomonas donggukensis]
MFGPVRRRRVMAAAWLALAPITAHAQDAPAPPQPPVGPDTLDPMSPMAPLPGIGVDWPDLAAAPLDQDAASAERAQIAPETRYSYVVTGIDGIGSDLLRQRFDAASTLRANRGDTALSAQIDRRAREDSALLESLLRSEGYYDARVTTRVEPQAGALVVTLDAEPGTLYRFAGVTLAGVEGAGAKAQSLRDAFGLAADAPVNNDTIAAAEDRLRTAVGEEGFAFGTVGEPQIVVDRATRTATLDLTLAPGTQRRFGRIRMDDTRIFGPDHVQDIARFTPGQEYDASALADLRRALIQTGLVSSVKVEPVEGADTATVDVAVALEPAPPRTIAGELGYGTGEGARAEVSWTHRNLFPPEGALTVRGVLGTREQLGSVVFRRNNFNGRDRVLTLQLSAAHTERDAYEADTLQLAGSLERQTNIFFQKAWTWSLGAELVATDERDVILATGALRRRTYFIGALPTSLTYDGSDDLLNPTRGFRLGGRFSPEASLSGSVFGYARIQVDASVYRPVTPTVVAAARIRLGTIAGAPRDAIAPSRRFYAGGGASVRGYGYQSIGPRDLNNDPIGGRSLTEFSIEARVKAFGNFGIVPFLDGGNIYTSPLPKFSQFRYGAGLGVRYYSNFGPIRIDVGTPLNPQPGDPRIGVYVSLGQAF